MYITHLQHGQYYHIYNRGNNRESIFKEEDDYHYFLDLYRKYIHPIADLYAYCLLPTHFHLLVFIKDLSDIDVMYSQENTLWMQFRRFLGTYTKAINEQYRRTGHLFAGSYSRICINEDNHFIKLISYIHQNPQNHGIVSDFKFWPFSSYDAYVKRDRRSLLARKIFSDEDLYTTILEMHIDKIYHPNISMP
jgi:putative transposase